MKRAAFPRFRWLVWAMVLWTVGAADTTFGQDSHELVDRIELPSSFNPVGSGARALGMGGAFVAVADDATAASWNPGGLIQLERPEVSAAWDAVHRVEDLELPGDPGLDEDHGIDQTSLNYLSAALPFALWGRNMVVSLNYQHLFDFKRRWSFALNQSGSNAVVRQRVEHRQEGRLTALGLAWALQMTPKLAVGMTVNVWDDDLTRNSWNNVTEQRGDGVEDGQTFAFSIRSANEIAFRGWNLNLGVLWNATRWLTLGAVLKTPFDADVTSRMEFTGTLDLVDPPGNAFSERGVLVENGTISMPMSIGLGAACRFSDEFIASLDIYRTEWDDFEYDDGMGGRANPVTGTAKKSDPTHQVRLGAEYLFIFPDFAIPARAGAFYDPAPAADDPDDFFGFTGGTGLSMERFSLDFAYQYRTGEGLEEHKVFGSLILYF